MNTAMMLPAKIVNLKLDVPGPKKGDLSSGMSSRTCLIASIPKPKKNFKKYKLRQMIVEHPFGTIKRGWGAYYFLTKRKVSVSAEISLSFLAYNLKRAINILGTEEILRRLRQRRKVVLA